MVKEQLDPQLQLAEDEAEDEAEAEHDVKDSTKADSGSGAELAGLEGTQQGMSAEERWLSSDLLKIGLNDTMVADELDIDDEDEDEVSVQLPF